MATLPTHAIIGYTAATLFHINAEEWEFWVLSLALPALPDVDALFMRWIPYEYSLGHRGFTHSLLFAAMVAGLAVMWCRHVAQVFPGKTLGLFLFFFGIVASHGLLDALTDGGLGVGFFIPFDDTRYFFPIQPIPVAPLGISRFFSVRSMQCLAVEFLLCWSFALAVLLYRFGHSPLHRAASMLAAVIGVLSWVVRAI